MQVLLTITLLCCGGGLLMLAASLLLSASTGWTVDPATAATFIWIAMTAKIALLD